MAKSIKQVAKDEPKKEQIHQSKVKVKIRNYDYGSIIFGVGLIIAIISSLINVGVEVQTIITITLIAFGLVIGFMNITERESTPFLVSMIVLILVLQPFFITMVQVFKIQNQGALKILGDLFINLITLLTPAAIIVAIKTIFRYAKDEN